MRIEKRRFPRATIRCKISAVFGERLLVFNSHTENIGEGGIRVILEQKLNITIPVDVELFMIDNEIPLRAKGEVVWANEMKPEGINPRFFDTGIKFTEENDYCKEKIRKLVDSLLEQEKEK
jgi:Tfp pilus assembly protein PilZ